MRSMFFMMAVAVPLFQSKGLSFGDIFILQAVFGATVAILEMPSGYLADLFGRKATLTLGTLFDGLGLTYLYFAEGFWDLVIFEILLGCAMSMISGIDLAILYDSITSKEKPEQKKKEALSQLRFMMQITSALGSIIGGYLASISFQTMLGAQLIIGWIPFLVAFTLKEPNIERMSKKSHAKNFKEIYNELFRKDKLLKLTVINWVVWSHATYFAFWMMQKYWEQLEIAILYFGIITAIYHLSAATFTKLAIYFESKLGIENCFYLIAFAPVVGYLSMYFFDDAWAVVFALCFSFSRGLTQIVFIDAINSRIPDKMRASVNSLNSFILRIAFICVGPLVGLFFDHWGLGKVSLGLAIAFSTLAFVLIPQITKSINDQAIKKA